jgi:ATP-dependent Clp protease ATP-binding subunit ClpX
MSKDKLIENKCSVCSTEATEDNPIINGAEFSICKSCAETALYLIHIKETNTPIDFAIEESKESEENQKHKMIKNPKDYKEILDRYVIGQDDAKKVLSVAIFNHLHRIHNPELKIDKSNVLFIGPTGSGKTFLAETISKYLDIPLAIVNTTSLTAAGYIGEDVSSVLERLWKAAGEDVQKAQKGIIFLDEIDKNRTSSGGTNNKDVSGKAVQQELLKILEGDIVKIYPEGSSKNRKSGAPIEINTKDILFIAGGAFVGLKDKPGVQMSALGKVQKEINEVPDTETLIEYGMIPEFIGRFPMIVELEEITKDGMRSIMTEPDGNIISQYKTLFNLSNVDLDFDEKAINEIATIALEKKTGARGLRNVMENVMLPYMFDISDYKDSEVNITYSYNKFKRIEAS